MWEGAPFSANFVHLHAAAEVRTLVNEKPVKVELQRADVVGRVERDPLLARSQLVATLGPGWRDALRTGRAKRAAPRAVLFQQGDAGEALLFLLSGSVRLFARKDTDTVELGAAHAGEVVGECEALARRGPRVMTAMANEVVEFVELSPAALFAVPARAAQLTALFTSLRTERLKALDEMTDFLNRW